MSVYMREFAFFKYRLYPEYISENIVCHLSKSKVGVTLSEEPNRTQKFQITQHIYSKSLIISV